MSTDFNALVAQRAAARAAWHAAKAARETAQAAWSAATASLDIPGTSSGPAHHHGPAAMRKMASPAAPAPKTGTPPDLNALGQAYGSAAAAETTAQTAYQAAVLAHNNAVNAAGG